MAAQINTGSQRKTRNSAKAAAVENSGENNSDTNGESGKLNDAFAATPNPSFQQTMAGMQEIIQSGNFLNEAFSDKLSLDEKLSLIITELYRIRETTTTTQENLTALQQQVQIHDQAIKQGATAADPDLDQPSERQEAVENRVATVENDIMDINTDQHAIHQKVTKLERQIDLSNRDLSLLKGFTEKHEKQLDLQERSKTQLTARGMSQNFTISGLAESKNENCSRKVYQFLSEVMEINVLQNDIKVAHRLGFFNPKAKQVRPRLMVVKVTRSLKEKILQNKAKLKGKYNFQGDQYYVNIQLPEAMMAEKKALSYEVNRLKKFNDLQAKEEDKISFNIKGKQLFVENELHVQNVFPPRPLELFVSKSEQQKMDKMNFTLSQPKTQDGSIFVGLAINVTSIPDVNRAYRKVRQMYPSYDHIMMGYRINNYSGYQDDGEHASGIKLHALIYAMKRTDVAVFVARNFGGSHLGPKRFDYIHQVAEAALKNLPPLKPGLNGQLSDSMRSLDSLSSAAESVQSVDSRSSYNSANLPGTVNNPGSPTRTRATENNFPSVAPEYALEEDWSATQQPTSKQIDATALPATQED